MQRENKYPHPLIILRRVVNHEWIFELPRITVEVDEQLDEGIEWMESGNLKRAETIFRRLVKKFPEHLDAYHHLAMVLDQQGKSTKATRLWQQAVDFALAALPAHFSMRKDRLLWSWMENRPFLRVYHAWGLKLMQQREAEKALAVFINLLALNPGDNQGVRALVVGCNFRLERPTAVLELCERYPADRMEQLLYGRALALFQLGFKLKAATALEEAVECLPLVAHELVKQRHKKPRAMRQGYIISGGADQAFEYWQQQGQYWSQTEGAIAFLRDYLQRSSGG